jgi:hypothetical protein
MPSSIISEWYKGDEVGKELALKKNLQDCFLWSSNLNAKLSSHGGFQLKPSYAVVAKYSGKQQTKSKLQIAEHEGR